MLATECSKPIAVNVNTGNHTATILEMVSRAEIACHHARQTSQLHRARQNITVGCNMPQGNQNQG